MSSGTNKKLPIHVSSFMNNQNKYSQLIYPWQCTNKHFSSDHNALYKSIFWLACFAQSTIRVFHLNTLDNATSTVQRWYGRGGGTRTLYTRTPLVNLLSPFSLPHHNGGGETWMRNCNLNPRSAKNQRLVSSFQSYSQATLLEMNLSDWDFILLVGGYFLNFFSFWVRGIHLAFFDTHTWDLWGPF